VELKGIRLVGNNDKASESGMDDVI